MMATMKAFQPPKTRSFGEASDSHKVNVLVVDDHPQNLVAMEAIVAAPDRNVVIAASGEEALKYLLEEDCGVVVLDVKLGGMDGYETAALIRKREKTRSLPIIFVTSYNKEEADVVKGYSHGAVDYIFKPIVPEILNSKISVFVELFKKTEDLRRKNEDLERAEKELMRTKAAARLIKHAPDPVFVSDLRGTILQANDAVSELLGLRAEEVLEQSLAQFVTEQETIELMAALREVVERGVTRNVRLNPRNSVGEIIPTMLNASALRDTDEKVIGAIGILRDMRAYEAVVRDLERSRSTLIDKIRDLEKFEEVVVGRELKMITMEKELEKLKGENRS
jgi:PAS domain S-box-containing protein